MERTRQVEEAERETLTRIAEHMPRPESPVRTERDGVIMNHGDRDEILARADIEEIDWHTDQCAVCAEYHRHTSTLVVFSRLRGSPHRQRASGPSLGMLTPKNAHFGELDFGCER